MKTLQAHYEDFLQDSRDSVLFSVADHLRLEEEVEACKTHFQHLIKSMENGVCLGKRRVLVEWEPWRVLQDPSYKLESTVTTETKPLREKHIWRWIQIMEEEAIF